MEKSIYTRECTALHRLLKQERQEAGLTQVQLAKKLKLTQSLYSRMERGECRMDMIQVRRICRILGHTLPEFAERLERDLTKE